MNYVNAVIKPVSNFFLIYYPYNISVFIVDYIRILNCYHYKDFSILNAMIFAKKSCSYIVELVDLSRE